MQKAAAFKDRFKIDSDKARLPVRLIAPRRDNRGGQYPQDEKVRELASQIIAAGFSHAEVDYEGVCVQEYPAEHIVKKKGGKPNFQTYDAFNRDAAQRGPQTVFQTQLRDRGGLWDPVALSLVPRAAGGRERSEVARPRWHGVQRGGASEAGARAR